MVRLTPQRVGDGHCPLGVLLPGGLGSSGMNAVGASVLQNLEACLWDCAFGTVLGGPVAG